jgi:predicted GNAT family N-acyltransferase
MLQDRVVAGQEIAFRTMAFSERIHRLCQHANGAVATTRPADVDEAKAAMAVARSVLDGLVGDDVVERALNHNPDIFQLIEGPGIPFSKTVFLAHLPLTSDGLAALVAGRFKGSNPDLGLVCRRGEIPAAIYVWLIFTPAAFAPSVRALALYLDGLSPEGCPMFTRAVNNHTTKLFPAMGFQPAPNIYSTAPDDLLVVLPLSGASNLQSPKLAPVEPVIHRERSIIIRVARTMEDMMKVFSMRAATYMHEQECPYDEEFDGNDFCATHFLGELDGEPAGCLRVRFFADFVKIERLAVRHEFRTSRMAFKLVRHALDHCRRKGYRRAYGHSRDDLVRFWGIFGFRAMEDRPAFSFSDVRYLELQAELAPLAEQIAIGADPYVLIRPEGAWDRPGPLDPSIERTSQDRALRIGSRVRTVRGADLAMGSVGQ